MQYRVRFLYWVLWWLYPAVELGVMGGILAFLIFHTGSATVGAGVALATVAMIVAAVVVRFRRFALAITLLKRWPTDSAVLQRQAYAALDRYRHQYAEALPALETSAQLAPDDANAWVSLAFALNMLGRSEDALTASERALALEANHPAAWARKAGALVNLGRTEEGLTACEHALALDPIDASAWRTKGHALQRLRRYEEALTAFDRALALDPEGPSPVQTVLVWYVKAFALYRLGRYKESVAACEQVLSREPNLMAGWWSKAVSLRALGREKEAWAAMRRVKELSA